MATAGDNEKNNYVSSEHSGSYSQLEARLAAKAQESLNVIKEDVCQWLTSTLKMEITPLTFLDSLDTGVALCKLVYLIQQAAKSVKARKKITSFQVPLQPLSCNDKAKFGSFQARDNTANFISWCREIGVEESVIFESEGLVLHKDEKRVILCLLDVARFAERMGIPPPQLVQMEREIEMLENTSDAKDPFITFQRKVQIKDQFIPEEEPTCSSVVTRIKSTHATNTTHKCKHSTGKIPRRHSQEDKTAVSRKRERGGNVDERTKSKSAKIGARGDKQTEMNMVVNENIVNESFEEEVMKKIAECTCQNKIIVTKCGNGKFLVKGASGKVITTYARVSDNNKVSTVL